MTSFIQREIVRARTFAGTVRCLDTHGRPIAGAMVSLYQASGAFRLGVAWAGEPLAALEPFARLGTDLLVPYPPSPDLLNTCASLSLRVTLVLHAPQWGETFPEWRGRYLPASPPLGFDPSVVTGWALDLGPRPAMLLPGGRPDTALSDALEAVGQASGRPVALLGLRLPLREPPIAAAYYGIHPVAPGTTGHLAELHRRLIRAAGTLGACFVHGLRAPQPDPKRLPRSWALGGAERFQAQSIAERVTLCFSVPGVTGVFCDRMVDREGDDTGLLAADLRPKRAYKLLRGLLQHEWRTRVRGATDGRGEFTWRGFHGVYELTVTAPDGRTQRAERAFTPTDATPGVWEVRVPDAP
jgi:hypothetical protein